MGLADDLRQAQTKAPRGCKMSALLTQLDKPDAEALAAALALNNTDLSHKAIAKALGANGYPTSPSTIGLHRNRGCSCVAG